MANTWASSFQFFYIPTTSSISKQEVQTFLVGFPWQRSMAGTGRISHYQVHWEIEVHSWGHSSDAEASKKLLISHEWVLIKSIHLRCLLWGANSFLKGRGSCKVRMAQNNLLGPLGFFAFFNYYSSTTTTTTTTIKVPCLLPLKLGRELPSQSTHYIARKNPISLWEKLGPHSMK